MIVPDSISLACNIGYEDAIKDKNMDKCLGDLFAKAFDSSLSTNERNSALKNFNNGYVEFLATTYFEALNMYNETMAFKNDEISPVITTQSTDIDASWRLAKEMHIVLAKSVNRLHKLWSRVLAMKMLAQYKEKQFVNKKDEE